MSECLTWLVLCKELYESQKKFIADLSIFGCFFCSCREKSQSQKKYVAQTRFFSANYIPALSNYISTFTNYNIPFAVQIFARYEVLIQKLVIFNIKISFYQGFKNEMAYKFSKHS